MSNANFVSRFVDKESVVLPKNHRFYQVAKALSAYTGVDILSITDNNELLTAREHEQAEAKYNTMLTAKPMPDASVLLAISDEEHPRILLTKRAGHMSSHAGEVSFVGGRRDEGDVSSIDVALREAYEEVRLPADDVEVLGFLPMQISKKGLLVRPVVASVSADVMSKLVANEQEIQKIFWLALDEILYKAPIDHQFIRQINHNQKCGLHTPAWLVDMDNDGDVEVVWGLTGRILANFLSIAFKVNYEWYYRVVNEV